MVYLYLIGFWQAGGGANGRRVTGSGRVGAQQVVEGGRYISASAGGISVVCSVDFCDGTDRGLRNVGY